MKRIKSGWNVASLCYLHTNICTESDECKNKMEINASWTKQSHKVTTRKNKIQSTWSVTSISYRYADISTVRKKCKNKLEIKASSIKLPPKMRMKMNITSSTKILSYMFHEKKNMYRDTNAKKTFIKVWQCDDAHKARSKWRGYNLAGLLLLSVTCTQIYV